MEEEKVLRPIVCTKVLVWNSDKTKFLMLLRGKTAPHGPLTWDIPGGDVEESEELIASAVREVKEESGLSVIEPITSFVYLDRQPDETVLTIFYECVSNSEEVNISWEHDEYRWLTYDEAKELKTRPKIEAFFKDKFL